MRKVAQRIKSTYDQGNEVVVVVSARSGVTNDLIARAKRLNPEPVEREMDMLLAVGEQETIALMAMALHALGIPAESRRDLRPESSPTALTPRPASNGSKEGIFPNCWTRAKW